MTTLTQIRKLATSFDETLSERFKEPSRSLMSKDFFDAFQEGARYQHAQSAKLIELLLEIVSVQGEALKCNKTFHSLGGIDDCEPCKAIAKVRELLEGYK